MNRKIHFGCIFGTSILLSLIALGFPPEPLAEAARSGSADIAGATKQHLVETYGNLPVGLVSAVHRATSGSSYHVFEHSPSSGGSYDAFKRLPLPAKALVSRTLGRDDDAFRAKPLANGFALRNARQHLAANFSRDGVIVRSGSSRFGLALRAYGYGDRLAALAPALPQARANQVVYRRGALTEWYVNGPVGLQQGFTLTKRPGRSDGKPLTIALALSKKLTALVDPGDAGLTLTQSDTQAALRYTGLMAYDATGRELRSWLAERGERLLLRVEDAEARYPLVVDPFIQVAKLTASDGATNDFFGAVALSGDGSTLAIGASSSSTTGKSGAAYVFEKPAGGWATTSTFAAKLTASDGGANDQFGNSVAISSDGSTVVVGAGEATRSFSLQGAVYVFVRPPSGWAAATETARLTTSDAATGDFFGLGLLGFPSDGSTIVVGACHDRRFGATTPGAAYVFEKPASGWATTTTFTAKLTASDGTQGSPVFGNHFCDVAMSSDGSTVVVGAADATVGSNNLQGAAYVFLKPSTGWVTTTETAKLTASDGAAGDQFSFPATDSDGGTVVVGAPGAMIGLNNSQGAAYVFVGCTPKPNEDDVQGDGHENGDDGHEGKIHFCKSSSEMDFAEPDAGRGMKGHMDAVTFSGANQAIITGSGTLGDGTPVNYTAVVLGNQPVIGANHFAISWITSTGSVFRALTDGYIVVQPQ